MTILQGALTADTYLGLCDVRWLISLDGGRGALLGCGSALEATRRLGLELEHLLCQRLEGTGLRGTAGKWQS